MKLIIIDLLTSKELIIDNPTFIPRKGDKVALGYTPKPTVEDVVFCYEENKIVVLVK